MAAQPSSERQQPTEWQQHLHRQNPQDPGELTDTPETTGAFVDDEPVWVWSSTRAWERWWSARHSPPTSSSGSSFSLLSSAPPPDGEDEAEQPPPPPRVYLVPNPLEADPPAREESGERRFNEATRPPPGPEHSTENSTPAPEDENSGEPAPVSERVQRNMEEFDRILASYDDIHDWDDVWDIGEAFDDITDLINNSSQKGTYD